MKITVITPTGGRPNAFEYCEKLIARQTRKPDQWIVVDDFEIPTECTMNQHLIRRTPYWKPWENTLQLNLIEGLKAVKGDIVLIMEDDDWYHRKYIENMEKKFKEYFDKFEDCTSEDFTLIKPSLIVAEALTKYYNIKNFSYMTHPNINHGSLFQTGFTADLIPQILTYLNTYSKETWFDFILWREIKSCHKIMFMTKYPWSIGLKGHTGRTGLGAGHNELLMYMDKEPLSTLYEWAKRKPNKDENYCIYVGYNPESRIRPDVLEQLKALSLEYSIIYITTSSELIKHDPLFNEVSKLVSQIIIRENKGHDFGSWKIGLSMLKTLKNDFSKIQSILLMNDSLYGPLFGMDKIINRTLNSDADITSMTSSVEYGPHAQSYYISYNNKIINSSIFKDFWDSSEFKNADSIENKKRFVLDNEIGFYTSLRSGGFSHNTLFDTGEGHNQTHASWSKLIDMGMPFIKNELLFKNPERIDVRNINNYLIKNQTLFNKMKMFWEETSFVPYFLI
jgi:glycosyltransferase involved in cell wall biosynthesis